jgi:hypothetical protein
MIKAKDLIKDQKARESRKILTFEKIYNILEKKIIYASQGDIYHIWYEIPSFILGLPLYSVKDCKDYLEIKLKDNGFKTTFLEPNILIINWNT